MVSARGARKSARASCSARRPARPIWLKTVIHEYAHIGCSSVNRILAASSEFYLGQANYPPQADLAVKNADSYTNFVLTVR